MKKIISNKFLELSTEEYSYYKESLVKALGPNPLTGMFDTDDDGKITAITLDSNQPQAMIAIFFLLNVRFNQALRSFSVKVEKIESLEKRIAELEEKLNDKS